MSDIRLYVNQDVASSHPESSWQNARGDKMGFQVVKDWYTQMAIERRVFQVRAGSISAPLVGDQPLADTAAEMCVDAGATKTIIPVYCTIAINLGTGTLHEYFVKSVGAASTVGDAFVPLPLYMGGAACTSTARVDAAGGCTVAADVVTTTRTHWGAANPVVVGAGHSFTTYEWEPRSPPILPATACCYAQITATGTGPSYFASLDFIELPTDSVN